MGEVSAFIKDSVLISNSSLKGGSVKISGYKHAAVQLIAATIIMRRRAIIENVPYVADMVILSQIINECGGEAYFISKSKLYINAENIQRHVIPAELSCKIRGSVYLIAAFLGALKRVEFSGSGGCQIGNIEDEGRRPTKHIIDVLSQFGAIVNVKDNTIFSEIDQFKPCTIDVASYSNGYTQGSKEPNGPMVGGVTKVGILSALVCDEGETTIENPYLKPDVIELLEFIKCFGYKVDYNHNQIKIIKQSKTTGTITYRLMSDISEIMTFLTLSVFHSIPIELTNVSVTTVKRGLETELLLLSKMGVKLIWGGDTLQAVVPKEIFPINIVVTSMGIYSDHQPMFALMLLRASGKSVIIDQVWNERFHYVDGLVAMGASIERSDNSINIYPSEIFVSNTIINANDLRAAAVSIIAALGVPGETVINNVFHINRGYDSFFEKLRSLNAKLTEI